MMLMPVMAMVMMMIEKARRRDYWRTLALIQRVSIQRALRRHWKH